MTAALLTATALVAATQVYAGWRLRRYAPRIAALGLPEATRSPTLQRALVLRPHCLPVYGSSEMAIAQPTRPDRFFHRRANGFDARLVGQAGDRCLPMLQELAALGPEARGRKVAVFLSPVWFLPDPAADSKEHAAHRQFAATFSPLQTGETLRSGELKPALKRRIAARLLDYDVVIRERSPLVSTALWNLAGTGLVRRGLFAALTPLLWGQNGWLTMQERWHWLEVSQEQRRRRHPAEDAYQARHKWMGWAQLQEDIARAEGKAGAANFYSLGPGKGERPAAESGRSERPPTPTDRDADFLRRMQGSPEWGDLDLLLQTARALGLRLLLVDQPINGLLSDEEGVTPRARQAYYRRVAQMAAAHHAVLRDFSAHEEEQGFFLDAVHPSARAWVWYDQALEEFYLGKGG